MKKKRQCAERIRGGVSCIQRLSASAGWQVPVDRFNQTRTQTLQVVPWCHDLLWLQEVFRTGILVLTLKQEFNTFCTALNKSREKQAYVVVRVVGQPSMDEEKQEFLERWQQGTTSTCWPHHRASTSGESLIGGGQPFGEGPAKKWGHDELDGSPGRVSQSIRANRREQNETERLNGFWTRRASWLESSRLFVLSRSDSEGAENKQVCLLFPVCGWK